MRAIFLSALLVNFLPLFAQEEEPALFYWDARPQLGFSNFGDALSEALIERMLGRPIKIAAAAFDGQKKLLGMGSIMSYAQDHDVVWGTGVNGKSRSKCLWIQYARCESRSWTTDERFSIKKRDPLSRDLRRSDSFASSVFP